jgi:predicted glutamine amidotransferase
MCGIFGMIGNVPEEYRSETHQFLTNMFKLSKIRGKDASGFSAIHNEGGASLITEKRPIESTKFVKRSTQFRSLRRAMPSIMIGHTRHSTAGNPNRGRNNHPFNNEIYSMVHNGTIKDWDKVVKDNGISMRSETDSELILRIIERYDDTFIGVQSVIDTVPRESAMAIALLKHSGDKISLSLFRNQNRPMVLVTAPALKSIFFCSTKDIVQNALKMTYKNGVDAKAKEFGLTISEFPEFRFMEFGLNAMGNVYTMRKEDLKRPIAGLLPAATTTNNTTSSSSAAVGYARGTHVEQLKNIEINNDDTREKVTAFQKGAQEASNILKLINTSPYITRDEILHWKKWRNNV